MHGGIGGGTLHSKPCALAAAVILLLSFCLPAAPLRSAAEAAGTMARQTATSSAAPRLQTRIAFGQNNNVYLVNADGTGRITVTTRSTDPNKPNANPISYPWYQWSPDGKYLLLVRVSRTGSDLLLLDTNGNVLRTLAHGVGGAGLTSWAIDGDQIAYVATNSSSSSTARVEQVDTSGNVVHEYPLALTGGGCGGGPNVWVTRRLYWNETGYEGVPATLSWSIRQQLAAIAPTCEHVTSTSAGAMRVGGGEEGALSTRGLLAGIGGTCTLPPETDFFFCLYISDTRTGHLVANLGQGELPSWSPDGRVLYFVRSTPTAPLTVVGPVPYLGEATVKYQTYITSIWRVNADGSGLKRLASMNAYGVGPLQVAQDGHTVVFSLVDNVWNLYHHLLPGNRYTQQIMSRFGPHVSIRMLDLTTGKVTIVVRDASRPAAQP